MPNTYGIPVFNWAHAHATRTPNMDTITHEPARRITIVNKTKTKQSALAFIFTLVKVIRRS